MNKRYKLIFVDLVSLDFSVLNSSGDLNGWSTGIRRSDPSQRHHFFMMSISSVSLSFGSFPECSSLILDKNMLLHLL